MTKLKPNQLRDPNAGTINFIYNVIFLSFAEIQSISEGKEKKCFKTSGRIKRASQWLFLFPCRHIRIYKYVTERYKLSLVLTSPDISRVAWLILNTTQIHGDHLLIHWADREVRVSVLGVGNSRCRACKIAVSARSLKPNLLLTSGC